MKKHSYLLGLAAATALLIAPINGSPLLAKAIDAGSAIAQNVLKQPKVELHLTAEKQQIQDNKSTWQAMTPGNSTAKPGDVIRFNVRGENKGNRVAKDLAITQPIPAGMTYVLNSATFANHEAITYSIDGGKTFVAKPTIKVMSARGEAEERPAPAEAYTHVRWNFKTGLEPNATLKTDYQVKVRS
jgi:uncharacterized repeat protein (TIGR01451 family)